MKDVTPLSDIKERKNFTERDAVFQMLGQCCVFRPSEWRDVNVNCCDLLRAPPPDPPPFIFFLGLAFHWCTRTGETARSRKKLTPCRHADIYLWSVKDQRACCLVFLTAEIVSLTAANRCQRFLLPFIFSFWLSRYLTLVECVYFKFIASCQSLRQDVSHLLFALHSSLFLSSCLLSFFLLVYLFCFLFGIVISHLLPWYAYLRLSLSFCMKFFLFFYFAVSPSASSCIFSYCFSLYLLLSCSVSVKLFFLTSKEPKLWTTTWQKKNQTSLRIPQDKFAAFNTTNAETLSYFKAQSFCTRRLVSMMMRRADKEKEANRSQSNGGQIGYDGCLFVCLCSHRHTYICVCVCVYRRWRVRGFPSERIDGAIMVAVQHWVGAH